jgi:hypothetical protein
MGTEMQVVYVAGWMRSGTTLIGDLLGASSAATCIGEIRPMMLAPTEHSVCDCGASIQECPVWGEPLRRWTEPQLKEIGQRGSHLLSPKGVLVNRLLGVPPDPTVIEYAQFLRLLAKGIETPLIVDTGKSPAGFLLWKLANVGPVHVVHILRDPRQVAKAEAKPTAVSGLPHRSAPSSFLRWGIYNSLNTLLGGSADTYTKVEFGKLLDNPQEQIGRIWNSIGLSEPTPQITGRTFTKTHSHAVSANPRRPRDGECQIRTQTAGSVCRGAS